nr:acetylcholine receptor subunit delta-like [Crassostrea gigas]
MDFSLLTVNDLNIKDQTFSVSALLSLTWIDSRMAWHAGVGLSQDYSSIPFMFSTEQFVWKPSIYVENSVEDLSVITDLYTPMRMGKFGKIRWSTSAIYKVNCESDIRFYPLDSQSCEIIITTASYTANEIRLKLDTNPVSLMYYTENGEWELLSVESEKPIDKMMGEEPFTKVIFRVNMRRRPLFHVLNTMFPVALMAFLIPMAFKLHVDSGEKMGYSLTVLLAYAVYLSMISENIPSTSVSICFISIYLASTLAVATIAVLFVIIVINVYHTSEDREIPSALESFAFCLESCFCKQGRKTGQKQSRIAPSPEESIEKQPGVVDDVTKQDEKEEEMTWKRLACLLDRFFFITFMATIGISTAAFIVIISLKIISY